MLSPLAAMRAIAVVEDDAAFGNALQYALEAQGYAVSLFDRAQAAIDSREILSTDCLLIDLPDGLTTLGALRRRRLTCPAILMGANLTARSRKEALEAGAIVLEKPVMGDVLNALLREVLADPR
jgi:DNA-binding response OmpR family regulator